MTANIAATFSDTGDNFEFTITASESGSVTVTAYLGSDTAIASADFGSGTYNTQASPFYSGFKIVASSSTLAFTSASVTIPNLSVGLGSVLSISESDFIPVYFDTSLNAWVAVAITSYTSGTVTKNLAFNLPGPGVYAIVRLPLHARINVKLGLAYSYSGSDTSGSYLIYTLNNNFNMTFSYSGDTSITISQPSSPPALASGSSYKPVVYYQFDSTVSSGFTANISYAYDRSAVTASGGAESTLTWG